MSFRPVSFALERIGPKAFVGAFLVFGSLFFLRSFTNYFVADDYFFLGRINLSNAGIYLTQSFGYGNEYRPVVGYSYALDAAITQQNPIGYHVTNTLLHIANALLVGQLILLVGGSSGVSRLTALIFLLNPVGHETVIWISGRPVVLGAFFVLSACCCFVRAWTAKSRAWHFLVAGYALFVLGLATYEVNVVTPALVVLACLLCRLPFSKYWRHVAALLLMTATYILLWNWFFHFRITRFPVETSILGAGSSFVEALKHSFHGSGRLWIAVAYIVLMFPLLRNMSRWKVLASAFAWFFLAYLPFFLVKGYADRFGYVASAATAVVIALALSEWRSKAPLAGALISVTLIVSFGFEMQKRVTAWKEAGEISRSIPKDIKRLLPEFPEGRLLVLLNVPLMHKGAYVYFTGLDRALHLEYPDAQINFVSRLHPLADRTSILLEYSGGNMVRRQWEDVESRYP
jgi:hypothetical protein